MSAVSEQQFQGNPIDLARYVRVYDDALPAEFCKFLVETFENNERFQLVNGSNAREGLKGCNWVEMNIGKYSDPPTQKFYMDRILEYKARYEQDCQLEPPLPDAPSYSEIIIKRYRPGGEEQFLPHFDSVGPYASRFLVILWYLNDVDEGGATTFVDLGIDVQPKAGRLLMFPPYWMYRHAGLPPVSGPKYIMSTYALW